MKPSIHAATPIPARVVKNTASTIAPNSRLRQPWAALLVWPCFVYPWGI